MKNIRLLQSSVFALLLPLAAQAGQGINSISDIESFLADITPRGEDFALTGTVLNVIFTPKMADIILTDEHGARAEFYRGADNEQPSPGDRVGITGRASLSKSLESFITIKDYEVIGHEELADPTPVKLSELNGKTHHLMTVCTEGTVVNAFQDEMDSRHMVMLLKDEGSVVPMSIPLSLFGDRSDLIDARIRVTGVYRKSVSGIRKVSWPNIQPTSPEDIEVIAPPPADPFSAPPLERQLYLSTDEIMRMSKRCVKGEVLATWGGPQAMVRTEDGRIVNLRLASGESLPPCGATIVAVGQPETDLFRINLAAVRWKQADAAAKPVTNETAASAVTAFWNDNGYNSINGEIHGKLLQARGIIRILPALNDTELRFVVDADGLQVSVDVTSNPSILDSLSIGCEVSVTGRCRLLTDSWRRDNVFPQTNGFALVARSPADVVVLHRPPWWTPARLIILIAVLLATLAAVEAWHLIQRHMARLKVVERTRLAVELHDSLSQNLAGVACQVAAGENAIEDDPKTAKSRIKAAERMLQSCRTELRHCLFDLRSDMLEETDFTEAILKALNQLTDEAAVSVRFTARRSEFPDPAAHAILSVIRELTANAIRHGRANTVKIAGCTDGGKLLFSVTDDGCGFDPQGCAGIAEGHFGLSGVRDRLKRLDGEISFASAPGKGTKATITLPIPKK